ncbi:hypothetical protein J6590_080362 [Homalodisca vitripennis]|nr:hypothetical protein J6590_080362 [Homalodisca vitripennis]
MRPTRSAFQYDRRTTSANRATASDHRPGPTTTADHQHQRSVIWQTVQQPPPGPTIATREGPTNRQGASTAGGCD